MRRFERRGARVPYRPLTAPLPPPTALVLRRQRLVPLKQLRLPAPQRNLPPPNEYVLHRRRELERIPRPDHHVRHLPRLERAVAVADTEDLGGGERHRAGRLVPRHPVRHRVPGLLTQVARVVGVGLEQRDFHPPLRQHPAVLVPPPPPAVARDVFGPLHPHPPLRPPR